MRTGKTVTSGSSTVEWEYVYEGGKLLQMKRGSRILDFSYDASGNPVSIKYRSSATANPVYYYYGVNNRGDVTSLYNSDGSVVAIYTYDAYGKLLSVKTPGGIEITGETSVAILNPLRYRGYVYDNETGFYYLQTRYYDPTTCRFINADGYCSTGQGILGNNMYAYCNNNPVIYSDPTGEHALNESCGNPTCLICRPERREFINSHVDWYNRVTGSNIIGVISTGQFILLLSKQPTYDSSVINITGNRK